MLIQLYNSVFIASDMIIGLIIREDAETRFVFEILLVGSKPYSLMGYKDNDNETITIMKEKFMMIKRILDERDLKIIKL
jgi:hypothetical protein